MTPDLPDGGRGGWNDELDEVLAGDLTAGLAYVTPAAGAVVTAIAPVGLRDREEGTVGFTVFLGFGRKLERIARDPHVALAYHARDHGKSGSSRFVLVQGHASARAPDPAMLAALGPQIAAHLGPPRQGKLFWDRWLREYYGDRVLVDVVVRRILSWPTLDCAGAPEVHGEPLLDAPPQREPAKGTPPVGSA
jgi:hypothetical protein